MPSRANVTHRISRACKWLAAAVLLALAACPAPAQCPGGVCPPRSAPALAPLALRYEQPAGHKAAVCRVYCESGRAGRSIGSGVLVRYDERVLVLTAYHVVRDGGGLRVQLASGQTASARTIATDSTWDVAALALDQAEPMIAAELAYAEDAMQRPGAPLESCGYGPDGRFAVNAGTFLRYRGSSRDPGGPADWMSISGQARSGDSGGPIFDRQGRVTGILWGTDGSEVIGAQAGRLILVVEQGMRKLAAAEQNSQPLPTVGVSAGVLLPICRPRQPAQAPTPVPPPTIPAPQVIVQSDPAIGRSLESIQGRLDQIAVNTAPPPTPTEPPPSTSMSPLLAGLVVLGAALAGLFVYFGTQKG